MITDTFVPPSSADAERAVIGGALVSPSLLEDLCRMVQASDFASPAHAALFAEIEARHRAGEPVDAITVADHVGHIVTDVRHVLAECIATHPSAQATLNHARTVSDLAVVRRIAAVATQTLSRIGDGVREPVTLLDGLHVDLDSIHIPNDPRPIEGLWVGAELLGAHFTEPPWVAPGLLREGWRLLFVGVEGGGKSTMLRQIVTGVACGRHPFQHGTDIEAKPGLIVDCENPESVVRDGLARMRRHVDEADLTILCRPGGIDIRQRRDRDLLHRVFSKVQPKIAAIGPLYKLYRQDKGEPDEQAAVAAQNVLDELRVTYGCALVIETHAPKGSSGFRELIPFGSSAWMRWPELGWKLMPCDERGTPDADGRSVKLGRFRGDRVEIDLPAWFDRGVGSWPWEAYWPHGIPRGAAA